MANDPNNHPAKAGFDISKLKAHDVIKHAAVHMNNNLMCAVDTETTGKTPGKNDLIQLAIIPLTPDFEMSKIFPTFNVLLKPKRPENVDKDLPRGMRDKFLEACTHGMDPWTAVDRLEEWFKNLHLPEKKKIVPLGCNYGSFDLPFIKEWLGGPICYDEIFRSDFRDVMLASLFINDGCGFNNLPVVFPKYNLLYLANVLQIEHPNPHDALADAWVTAQIYKKMMRYYDHFQVIGSVRESIKDLQFENMKPED